MTLVTTVEYKIKCMAFLSYSTLADLAEYFHLSPMLGSNEDITEKRSKDTFHFSEKRKFDFSAMFDLPMEEQKCCENCKHSCYLCREVECTETVDCMKSPCQYCGKVSNKCHYLRLRSAIIVFKSLLELCGSDNNYTCFENENDYVFPQFPFCYTVELMWDQANTALEFCLDFLLKTGFLLEETTKDRLMNFRLLLKRPKYKIATIFGNDIIEMFPELASEVPEASEIDDIDISTKKDSDGMSLCSLPLYPYKKISLD